MDQETANILEYYFSKFDSIYVAPIIFIEFVCSLIFAFTIRYTLLWGIEKNKNNKKTANQLKAIKAYIFSHCGLELLIAFFIAYCLIKLTFANPTSYIINIVAAPAIGVIIAIYIDNKIIIPLESATGIGNIFEKIKNKSSNSEKNIDTPTNNVTINIGSGEESKHTDLPNMKLLDSKILSDNIKHLSKNIADDDDFNIKIIDAINSIKDIQLAQNDIIVSNTEKLENTIKNIGILKESEMINKKIELKRLMYDCLNKGFATPSENDKITMFFHSYTSLGGNHEVETLYKEHYINLKVHEERRTNPEEYPTFYSNDTVNLYNHHNNYNDEEKEITNKKIYLYGEFDNIISEDDKKDKNIIELPHNDNNNEN